MLASEMNSESWLERNQPWIMPLVGSLMIMTVLPLLQSLSTPAQPINIPAWAKMGALFAGCIGLLLTGIMARLTTTLSAQLICAAGVVAGYTIAVFLLLQMLKG